MIDWFLAQRLARYVASEPDVRPPATDLQALAADSATRVIAYTGLTPARELPLRRVRRHRNGHSADLAERLLRVGGARGAI